MALYTLRKMVAIRVVGGNQCGYLRESTLASEGTRLALTAWLMLAVLLTSTVSIAAPYDLSSRAFLTSGVGALPVAKPPAGHSDVLAAAFGFQAAGSSTITVRTYDAPTGAILSEDSFDVNVKEEGAAEHDENKGRIFAGGIGTDSKGKSTFILRVYDAETGRFLWEGQLNLLKLGEGGTMKASAALIPSNPAVVQTSADSQEPLQTLFYVRAVNPVTGGLVWQDQFVPGSRKRARAEGVLFDAPRVRSIHEPIGHMFDLVVRTYDRTSGTLLWEDSFEQLDRIEKPATEPETNAYPQAIPFWNPIDLVGSDTYRTALR